ncbi:MAG: hypothetical protein J6K28_03740 [Alistipes sp.]|nr:hypothetical protein [Alistipes sp.]
MKRVTAIMFCVLILSSCSSHKIRVVSSERIKTNIVGIELCSNQNETGIEKALSREFPDKLFMVTTQIDGKGKAIRAFSLLDQTFAFANLSWTYVEVDLNEKSQVYCIAIIGSYESVENAKKQYDLVVSTYTEKYGKGNYDQNSSDSETVFWTDDVNSVGVQYEKSAAINGSDRSFCTLYYTNIALLDKFEKYNTPDI